MTRMCAVTPLFIVSMNWINNNETSQRRTTVGCCRINCSLLFADNFVLPVSTEPILNVHLITFLLRATMRE